MPHVYVGTYSSPALLGPEQGMQGRAEGIYRLRFDEASGVLAPDCLYPGILNPSYLTLSRDGLRLFCVHELDTFQGTAGGGVSSYAIEETGLRLLCSRPTNGGAPCHVALAPAEDLLCVANYSGGSVSAYTVDDEGMLGVAQTIVHHGKGPNRERQDAPHVHSTTITPVGTHAIVADLGTDTLTAYAIENTSLLQEGAQTIQTQPGDGPRTCAYDAKHNALYVACEMTSRIAVFACDASGVPQKYMYGIPTLPDGMDVPGNSGADVRIAPDYRFLYASNRGHNSLSVFSIAPDAQITLVQNIPTGGKTPRAFTLSPTGRWLLCANQDSDTITTFAIDKEKGTLTQHAELPLPSPVCLVFAQ